jgi:hypothetical protein
LNRDEAQKRSRDYDKHRDSLIELIKQFNCTRCAEIGVFESLTAARVLSGCEQLEYYLMVDQWKEFSSADIPQGSLEDGGYLGGVNWNSLYENAQLIAKRHKCSKVLRGDSSEIAKTVDNEFLDLVFIDASHAYSDVRKDLESWYPKVRTGGIIAGHDYYSRWPGVVKAVDEFFKDQELFFLPDTVWYTKK